MPKPLPPATFPLGGIGVSDEIAEAMLESGEPWMHAYTYSAHPTGCAVALAMLDMSSRKRTSPPRRPPKGIVYSAGLKSALADHPHVGDVRGLGLMCGVEYVKDRASKEPFDARRTASAPESTRPP